MRFVLLQVVIDVLEFGLGPATLLLDSVPLLCRNPELGQLCLLDWDVELDLSELVLVEFSFDLCETFQCDAVAIEVKLLEEENVFVCAQYFEELSQLECEVLF